MGRVGTVVDGELGDHGRLGQSSSSCKHNIIDVPLYGRPGGIMVTNGTHVQPVNACETADTRQLNLSDKRAVGNLRHSK